MLALHDKWGAVALPVQCALLLDYGPPEEPLVTPLPNARKFRFTQTTLPFPPPTPVSTPPGGGGGVTGWFQKNAIVSYCTRLHNYESSLLELMRTFFVQSVHSNGSDNVQGFSEGEVINSEGKVVEEGDCPTTDEDSEMDSDSEVVWAKSARGTGG